MKFKILFIIAMMFLPESRADNDSAAELALRYRVLAHDFQTSPAIVNEIFLSYDSLATSGLPTLTEASNDREFIAKMNRLSTSLNQLLSDLNTDEQKRNSLEAIVTLISQRYPHAGAHDTVASVPHMYADYLRGLIKNNVVASPNPPNQTGTITIKRNEVIKTIGTYGIWGFWFVTSTWGLVQFSPKMEHLLYYPAIAMFIASAPFSISNQIWSQVFDRIERKAIAHHQTMLQYLKAKAKYITAPTRRSKAPECLTFY